MKDDNIDQKLKERQENLCDFIDSCHIKKDWGITSLCHNDYEECIYYRFYNRLKKTQKDPNGYK